MQTRSLRWLGAAGLVAFVAACSSPAPPAALTPAAPPAPSSTSSSPTSTAPEDDGGPARKCVLSDLGVELSAPQGGSNQRTTRVVWTNTSSKPCTMTGFGGADLVASPRSEERYSLPRTNGEPRTVRLAPGERAHSTITYLPATGDGYRATQLLATPPDETHAAVLRWTEGPVTDQRSATRPGTFLGPVQPGAS